MAGLNLTPSTSVLTDREISTLFDTSLENLNASNSWKLLPFVETLKDDWDLVIESIENAYDKTRWVADEENPDSGTIGKGYRTVISAETFANGFKLTRETQKKFESLKDSAQKEKMQKHIDKAILRVLKGIQEFVDREINALVSDAFLGTFSTSFGEAVPVISPSHAFASGVSFSNRIDVGGTLNKSFDHGVLDHFAVEGARIATPDGKETAYEPDTMIVPFGTSVAQSAREILGYSNFTPTTLGNISVYQDGVKGINLIVVKGLGKDRAGADLAFRDSMYFMYSTEFNDLPVYVANFPTEVDSKLEIKSNRTKEWSSYGDLGLGTQNVPVGLFGSKGNNVA